MKKRETITALIIAKNEEKNIAACLETVKWCDDIVVVDDMSEDDTVNICESYGARVFRHKSHGNYNDQCAIGLENTKTDWVFNIDADERMPLELKREIQDVLSMDSRCSGYSIARRNHFLGRVMKHGGWQEQQVKLFRLGRGRYIKKTNLGVITVDGEIGYIKSYINHYPFNSISQYIDRQIKYVIFEAMVMHEVKGKMDLDTIRYHIRVRPWKLFFKLYIKKQGFMDGMHGFIFSVLSAWRHFALWSIYWNKYCSQGGRRRHGSSYTA